MREDWRTRSLSRGCVRLKAHYVDSRRAPACISTPASCPASIFPDRPSTRIQPRKYSQVIVSRSLRKRQASAASTYWCLTLEPSKVRAFERKPQENAIDTSRMLADLEKTATILQSHLAVLSDYVYSARARPSSSSATYSTLR